jgi:hypothetical protein
MTKPEIDDMMARLPSQKRWAYERSSRYVVDEALAGLAFTVFIIMICLL